MATPAGLVVPNIKDVQKRNVASIAAELTRLQRDATLGRVNQSDVTGGTISMSNIGEGCWASADPMFTACRLGRAYLCCLHGRTSTAT